MYVIVNTGDEERIVENANAVVVDPDSYIRICRSGKTDEFIYVGDGASVVVTP